MCRLGQAIHHYANYSEVLKGREPNKINQGICLPKLSLILAADLASIQLGPQQLRYMTVLKDSSDWFAIFFCLLELETIAEEEEEEEDESFLA